MKCECELYAERKCEPRLRMLAHQNVRAHHTHSPTNPSLPLPDHPAMAPPPSKIAPDDPSLLPSDDDDDDFVLPGPDDSASDDDSDTSDDEAGPTSKKARLEQPAQPASVESTSCGGAERLMATVAGRVGVGRRQVEQERCRRSVGRVQRCR